MTVAKQVVAARMGETMAVNPLAVHSGASEVIPKYRLPDAEMPPDAAYQIVHDELMVAGVPAQLVNCRPDKVGKAVWFALQFDARLQSGQGEHVADHPVEPGGLAVHVGHELALHGLEAGAWSGQRGEAGTQRGDRALQLVR